MESEIRPCKEDIAGSTNVHSGAKGDISRGGNRRRCDVGNDNTPRNIQRLTSHVELSTSNREFARRGEGIITNNEIIFSCRDRNEIKGYVVEFLVVKIYLHITVIIKGDRPSREQHHRTRTHHEGSRSRDILIRGQLSFAIICERNTSIC